MKLSNLSLNVGTAIGYPFVLIFLGVPVWIFLLILMLGSLVEYGKDNDYREFKYALTPKRYLLTVWQLTVDKAKEGNQEMRESWPILLGITIIPILIVIVYHICTYC